jgi:hypothetical protein
MPRKRRYGTLSSDRKCLRKHVNTKNVKKTSLISVEIAAHKKCEGFNEYIQSFSFFVYIYI